MSDFKLQDVYRLSADQINASRFHFLAQLASQLAKQVVTAVHTDL